jgi:NitT/TauT family transport system substrate-binding protein
LVNILQTSMNNSLVIVSRKNEDPLLQKGMRVGTWSVGFDQMAICMSLKEGLDYQWIPFSSGLNLFLSGAIDATLAMSYNEANQLLEAGFTVSDSNTYRFCEHGYNVQEDGVYMTRQYYESHKEQARKFAEASRRGWEWAVEHPDETLDIVMDYVTRHHIATNRVMQKLMLEEVLRLLTDRESGQREYRLRPDMVKLANSLMLENQLLLRGVPYEELIAR